MRCSQTRIHSALPFTAPPLLFVCRLPPIFIATQPVINTVGYTSKTLEENTWYLVANNFESVSSGAIDVQNFVSGLTATDDASTAPVIQYWNGTKLETLYYLQYLWDPVTEKDVAEGWGNVEFEVVHWTMDPGVACWLKVKSGPQTVTCSGQVVSLAEKEASITTAWQLVGSPYPIAVTLNTAAVDCSGLTATDDASTAPVIQYWNGTKLETIYYLQYLWDPVAEKDVAEGWGNVEFETVNKTFEVCEGFWVKTKSGTGTIKFSR